MASPRIRIPAPSEQALLERLVVRPVDPGDAAERSRFRELMERHHYLRNDSMVGEQLRYVAEADGEWLALLGWSAAAKHLKDREEWIGWNASRRRCRLALAANNARFLVLPGIDCPNLASRALALCCGRLAGDWEEAYGHPVLVAESFVDSQLFRGTCYKAQGWTLLGLTAGSGRRREDYYTEHGRPKQLWVRELAPGARATLRAERLPCSLQHVEDAVVPLCGLALPEVRKLRSMFLGIPDWRAKKGRDYSLPCLLAIMAMASLAGVVRGQRDLAAFASKLTQRQLKALGSYRRRDGRWDYPKETTFQRVLAALDAEAFERVLIGWELRRAGEVADDQVAIDGKAQRGSAPHSPDEQKPQLVSAQSQPSGRVLGTVAVERKSNEPTNGRSPAEGSPKGGAKRRQIPAARALMEKLGPLDGKLLMLDALHCCQQTVRQACQDHGADFLIPVKGNQAGLEARAEACLPGRQKAVIPPLGRAQGAGSPAPAVRYRRKPG